MNKEKQLIVNSIEDECTVTACMNGYLMEVSGKDARGDYRRFRFLLESVDELVEFIRMADAKFEARA